MTSDGHEAAEYERARLFGLRRLDEAVRRAERERERRRVATLIGPGHNYDLAPDAPLGSDPRFDHTGFAPGGLL